MLRSMRLTYRILNVFTVPGDRLSGNPLCVFEDGGALETKQMQALARQLNLSETTFILPPSRATARVRIFTPNFEMPFAGHPTLGTAHVVRSLQSAGNAVSLELEAGLVPVTADGDRWTLQAPKVPSSAGAAPRADVARMIGLAEADLAGDPQWIDTGVQQLVIPIMSVAAVQRAVAVPGLVAQHGIRPGGREAMAYLWARDERAPGTLVVRFFFTQDGAIIEDPATGSACANLGGYLLETGVAPPFAWTLRQGDAVQRPSQLDLRVDAERRIHVTGSVVELGSGSFEI